MAIEKGHDLPSTHILQQKNSWTTKAIMPSIMGASIAEKNGLERSIMLPKPEANHRTASPVDNAVWAVSRIYSPYTEAMLISACIIERQCIILTHVFD